MTSNPSSNNKPASSDFSIAGNIIAIVLVISLAAAIIEFFCSDRGRKGKRDSSSGTNSRRTSTATPGFGSLSHFHSGATAGDEGSSHNAFHLIFPLKDRVAGVAKNLIRRASTGGLSQFFGPTVEREVQPSETVENPATAASVREKPVSNLRRRASAIAVSTVPEENENETDTSPESQPAAAEPPVATSSAHLRRNLKLDLSSLGHPLSPKKGRKGSDRPASPTLSPRQRPRSYSICASTAAELGLGRGPALAVRRQSSGSLSSYAPGGGMTAIPESAGEEQKANAESSKGVQPKHGHHIIRH